MAPDTSIFSTLPQKPQPLRPIKPRSLSDGSGVTCCRLAGHWPKKLIPFPPAPACCASSTASNGSRNTPLTARTPVGYSPNFARLHEAVSSCDGLAGEVRHRLLDAIAGAHPEHFVEKQNIWEDGNIYLAAEGYARLHAALDKILNQDMRQNAMAIGAAAEKGDLRENWEYKSALEERDRLVERATRMRQEFDNARVLSPSDITNEHVTVGVTVRLRDLAAGNERSLTFLGPWDADIEQGVYSYLAPLSLGFMGKKLGDRITADLGAGPAEYEITAIETAV